MVFLSLSEQCIQNFLIPFLFTNHRGDFVRKFYTWTVLPCQLNFIRFRNNLLKNSISWGRSPIQKVLPKRVAEKKNRSIPIERPKSSERTDHSVIRPVEDHRRVLVCMARCSSVVGTEKEMLQKEQWKQLLVDVRAVLSDPTAREYQKLWTV